MLLSHAPANIVRDMPGCRREERATQAMGLVGPIYKEDVSPVWIEYYMSVLFLS